MVERTRKLSEIERERRVGLPDWPEWMDKYDGACFSGITVGVFRKLMEGGFLPPRVRDTRPHRWNRGDLVAWLELRKLGLFGDYKQLVQEHGEHVAWQAMLQRLERARAEIRKLAGEVR